MTTMATVETVGELGRRLSRLTPVSPGCDQVRRVDNGLVDKRPAVIARCLNSADVVDAVSFGRERGLELSVQAPRSTSASGCQGSAGEASTASPEHETPPSEARAETSKPTRTPRLTRRPCTDKEIKMARVRTSKRYEVSGQGMWERIGDPGRIHEWHPGVDATEMLDGGRTRVDRLGGGERVSSTILEQAERHYTDRVDESPLPLDNLVETLRVRDEGEGACVVEWEATFDPTGMPEDEAVELVRGIYQAGLDAL